MKLLSIIVPFYNVEPYFKQCIESLIDINHQEKYEILLIDDCGTDDSLKIAAEYAQKFPKLIQLIFHQKNAGISAARNTGMLESSGKYIMFVDSDDWISESSIDKIIQNIEKKQPDLLFFDFTRQWPEKSEPVIFNNQSEFTTRLTDKDKYQLISKLPVTSWGKIFKRDIIIQFKFPIGVIFEDVAVIPAVIITCKSIYYVPLIKYQYRQRRGSYMDEQRGTPDLLFNAYSLLHQHITDDNVEDLTFITVKDLLINVRVAYRTNNIEKALTLLSEGNDWLCKNYPNWRSNEFILKQQGSSKWYLSFKAPLLLSLLRFDWGRRLFLLILNNEKLSFKKIINMLLNKPQV